MLRTRVIKTFEVDSVLSACRVREGRGSGGDAVTFLLYRGLINGLLQSHLLMTSTDRYAYA